MRLTLRCVVWPYWGRTTPDALALTDSRTIPEIVWLLEKAKFVKVGDGKPVAILMGRHLLEKGMKPGKEMGIVLAAAFEAQLDGLFDTLVGAEEWLTKHKEIK